MRQCEECTVCCYIGGVHEELLEKPAHTDCPHLTEGGCGLHGKPERPFTCQAFRCAWLHGFGGEEDRPDKVGAMVTINSWGGNTKGGDRSNWIFVIDIEPGAHAGPAKDIVLDVVRRVPVPAIVVDADARPPDDTGDYVVIRGDLMSRASRMAGMCRGWLSSDVGVYQLRT